MLQFVRFIFGVCLVSLLVGLTGCREQAPITKYQIPKEVPSSGMAGGMPSMPGAPGSAASAAEPTKSRMLAAIIVEEPKAWFFKLMGNDEPVSRHVDGFREFVTSIKFADGSPEWELPEGWKQKPGSGMRFATLNVGQPSLDVSVIALPSNQSVLENVNRWRGQLQQSPLEEAKLGEAVEEIETAGGATASFVDIRGMSSGDPMRMTAPFAGGGGRAAATPSAGGPATAPDTAAANAAAANPGFDYTMPENWSVGRSGGMRKLAFNVENGDATAEVTVTTLAIGGAALLPNVNRWRGQVGLPPTDQATLDESVQQIEVGDVQANFVELVGEQPEDAPQGILVAIAPREGVAWFFKMMGDASLVTAEKNNFQSFIDSVSFPKP